MHRSSWSTKPADNFLLNHTIYEATCDSKCCPKQRWHSMSVKREIQTSQQQHRRSTEGRPADHMVDRDSLTLTDRRHQVGCTPERKQTSPTNCGRAASTLPATVHDSSKVSMNIQGHRQPTVDRSTTDLPIGLGRGGGVILTRNRWERAPGPVLTNTKTFAHST